MSHVPQPDFARALLDPRLAVPEGLIAPDGRPAAARFDVYRNNVVAGLIAALETAFPVVRKLLGVENFRHLGGIYVRAHPPENPLMMHYGAAMPGFLAGFEPVQHLGYLADVARLELARRRAYHAPDAAPISPEQLQGLPPERLLAARFMLAPALSAIRSDWPLAAIWRFNTEENAPKPAMRPEDVLISRPGFDPVVHLLPPGGADFVETLQSGGCFGDACATLAEADIAAMLGLLLQGQAIIAINEDMP
ncbi:MAG: DNA-binding domain-containing protein [Rhodobacteraceae bacterium]|nr:DNA-binding domain-containing protein [Paracoccaceae bacterium]